VYTIEGNYFNYKPPGGAAVETYNFPSYVCWHRGIATWRVELTKAPAPDDDDEPAE